MADIPDFVTVRDPKYSLWQSIVEKVAKQKNVQHLVDACHAQVFDHHEVTQGRTPEAMSLPADQTLSAATAALPLTGPLQNTKRCSALAAQLAWAKVFGTSAEFQALQGAFDFNVCDPFWAKCVEEYTRFYTLHGGQIPYRPGIDNVLPLNVPATAKIAIFGDWATGMANARYLLQEIKGFSPDILMHLGDIYYSGTLDEVQERFLNICTNVFGSDLPPCFSLAGNHDMYSGGAGYYWLVDKLGQGASYFAIQNADWLFIGMDTGRHDLDPTSVSSTTTFLEPSEADWVNGLIAKSQNQKIVLLSHHPLFSAYDAIASEPVNMLLLNQLAPSLTKVTAWFWGHEHRLGVYEAFQGLQRGRCLGHAAVPVFADETGDPPKLAGVPILQVNGAPLNPGVDDDGVFKHGYAIMELNGKDAKVSYYRSEDQTPLWSETF
jgi:hypothetical protein